MGALIKVPFHGGEILAVADEQGEHVVIKPLCESLGIDVQAQQRRLLRAAWGQTCTAMMAVQIPGDDQRREVFCLHRKRVAMWLATLDAARVRRAARPYLVQLQNEAADVLDAYFADRTQGARLLGDHLLRLLQSSTETQALHAELGALRNELAALRADLAPVLRPAPRLLSSQELTAHLGISRSTFRRHLKADPGLRALAVEIPTRGQYPKLRWRAQDVEAHLRRPRRR